MGLLLKWLINIWISLTGKHCSFEQYPWLKGPMGDGLLIGDAYYKTYADKEGLDISMDAQGGLVEKFKDAIPDSDAFIDNLSPEIEDFYEHTAAYKLEVWSQWYQPFAWGARMLIKSLSSKMNQLNIPLHPFETSHGMSNQVIHLKDKISGKAIYTCWLRKSILTGNVVYSGFYSRIEMNQMPFVRVVFPLPDGNATVILRVVTQADGSVKLLSDGKGIGDTGYYRVQRSGDNAVRVKYIPLKESIHVFKDKFGDLRTDHVFVFLGKKMLHLHYKMNRVA